MLALGSTSSTVFAIVAGVDTNPVAVSLAFGTSSFYTFALVTVMLARTAFGLCAPFKATTSVLDTCFVLTWQNVCLCRALPGTFFALGVRTIRDTLVLFTLFKLFAHCPAFTGSPHPTFALLGSFHTGFAIGGKTPLG